MKANIISLEKDTHRRTRLKELLKQTGYEYEIFCAIDKKSSQTAMKDLGTNEVSHNLTPGEIGCALSHLSLYENPSSDHIMILEDDVTPTSINPFSEDLSPPLNDGEVLLLGITTKREWLGYRRKEKRLGIDCMQLDAPSIPMLRGACAYVINKNTARAISALQKRKLSVADAWANFYKNRAVTRFLLAEHFEHPVASHEQSNLEEERQQFAPNRSTARKIIKKLTFNALKIYRTMTGGKNV